MTILYMHDACILHEVTAGHPESPKRLRVLKSVLSGEEFSALDRRDAPRGTIEQIALMHSQHHIEQITKVIPENELIHLDGDTSLSLGSCEAALRGSGAVCAAIDSIMTGPENNAFCAVRPPGHHAESDTAMGFCLLNNVAIGAAYARHKYKIDRVAVMDFDVHHGNGTQAMFWSNPNLFYASTHQMPLFPGTGAKSERGKHGNVLNAPLRDGDGSLEFRSAMENIILPGLKDFKPELLIISAGFDAHFKDPLAGLRLVEDDYAWATLELLSIADKYAESRLVSVLEGGYNLDALASSVSIHVLKLMSV
jgi:acetoin utilization deacetylase AcuC-like enzyme